MSRKTMVRIVQALALLAAVILGVWANYKIQVARNPNSPMWTRFLK